VAKADLLLVSGREIERVDHIDGVADVAGPLLLVERAIGSKQHAIGPEEFDAANQGGARAFDRRVAIEFLEVIIRALLQALEQSTVVLVRSTRAQLIEAVRNATLEIGNDSSQMMRNDLELRITIHYSGKNEPGKSDAGLVRPAE